jgi:hypothetical protein
MFGPKLEGLATKLEMEHTKGIHVLVTIKQVWMAKSSSIKREVLTYREYEKYIQNIGEGRDHLREFGLMAKL